MKQYREYTIKIIFRKIRNYTSAFPSQPRYTFILQVPVIVDGSVRMLRLDSAWLWEIAAGTLSLLFPQRCPGCDRIDIQGFCENCNLLFEWLDPSECCVRCGAPLISEALESGRKCARCRSHPPSYTQAVAALRYSGPLARSVILWKYEGERSLSRHLSELLIHWTARNAPKWWEKIDAIIPAPHHPKTFRMRGFSPPEDLAYPLACAYAIPYLPRTLFKIRYTRPQANLSREIRIRNLRMSMKVFDRSLVDGKTVLVVDDVMTTGATMGECARALKEAGSAKVYGIVLARQADEMKYPKN